MKKIMIDVDGVIADGAGYLVLVNEFLNTNYSMDDVKSFYIQDLVPSNLKEEFTNFFITKNTYENCNLYPNSVEVIKELNERYEIYICSAYIFRDHLLYSGDSLKYKFDFLVETFPFLDPNRFTFQTNKSILNCEIKIDDAVDNLQNADIKLLFTANHNKHISDEELKRNNIIRVNSWNDIREVLL